MPGFHVPLHIPAAREGLVTEVTLVAGICFPLDVHIAPGTACSTFSRTRCIARMRLQVQAHVLVEITRIAEGSQAELAL